MKIKKSKKEKSVIARSKAAKQSQRLPRSFQSLAMTKKIILLTFLFLSFIFIVKQVYAQPAPTAPATAAPATTPAATTPAATTPAATTPAPAAGASDADTNANWTNNMPVNANTYSTDWLAVILSIIIGILAITVPWGMMNEVTNAVKKGYAALTKGPGKWIADKSGLTAQMKSGGASLLKKAQKNKTLAGLINTAGRAWRGNQYAEEDWKKAKEDMTQNIDYSLVTQYKSKHGTLDNAPDRIQNIAKRLGGEMQAKAAESANQPVAATRAMLEKAHAGEFWDIEKRMRSGDEGTRNQAITDFKKFDKTNIPDIIQYTDTLRRQLNSANPTTREEAEQTMSELRGNNILPGELETADLRTFKLGAALSRPTESVADQPIHQTDMNNLRAHIEGDVAIDPKSINNLAEDIASRTNHSRFEVDRIASPVEGFINQSMMQQNLSQEQAVQGLNVVLANARDALGAGEKNRAATILQRIDPTINEMTSVDRIQTVLNNSNNFLTHYQSNPQTAREELQKEVQSRIVHEETAHIINRGANGQFHINAHDVDTLKQNQTPASLNQLPQAQLNKVREYINGIFNSENQTAGRRSFNSMNLPTPPQPTTPAPTTGQTAQESERERRQGYGFTPPSNQQQPPTPPTNP